jgi:hypothetical protein
MDLDKLTIGELRQLVTLAQGLGMGAPPADVTAIPIGEAVLIRGVTLYYLGRVEAVTQQEIVLTDASWIGDTGRFSQALASGVLSEVEPYPAGRVVVGRGAVMDVSRWPHDLPRQVKP